MLEWIKCKMQNVKAKIDNTSEEETAGLEHDISVAKLEDDGSVYLFFLDWDNERIHEHQKVSIFESISNALPNSTIQIIQGQLGGDIEVVETSVAEVFERDEE
jgi:hypothetical protein